MKSIKCFFLAALLALGSALGAAAQDKAGTERLGKVHFPTSCSSVQAQFDRAVALLHSFWLQAALEAFTDVTRADPGCAMGHWGVAMTWLGKPLAGAAGAKGVKGGGGGGAKGEGSGGATP